MRYTFDQFALDSERFEISENGSPVHAEPQVIELLLFFVRNQGRLVSRDELNQAVWKGRIVSDSAISGRIKVARKLLGDDGRRQKYIRTIHKKGFSFNAAGLREEAGVAGGTADEVSSRRVFSRLAPWRRNTASKPSIGVLRFSNLSPDAEQNYFAEGITEDLVTTLSKISKLVVVTHPGTGAENNAPDARQAGVELEVLYVLYGSVRVDGDRLRISVQLLDTRSGQCLWAQRYDRRNREVFRLQDEVTKEVVSALQVELTEGDQALLLSRGTDNIEAWQLTFQGQAAVLEHHQKSVRRGLMQLDKAVRLDENYALAWSALAVAHWKESVNEGWSDSREASLKHSVEASDRAMALEADNAGILAMRSLIFVSLGKFDEALGLATEALHLANSEANTIALAGITLRYCCQPDQAIAYTLKAMELCPIYPAWYPYGIAICYWMKGELEPAIEFLDEALEIDPELSLNYLVLAMIRAEQGQERSAREAIESVFRVDPKFSGRAVTQGLPFSDPAVQARRERALQKAGLPL